MGGFSALKTTLLKDFAAGNVECRIIPQRIGKDYELVFMFMKSEKINEDYCAGVQAVAEPVLKKLEEKGLSSGHNVGGGYSNSYGGHFVKVTIPASELEIAKHIQQSFSKSIAG